MKIFSSRIIPGHILFWYKEMKGITEDLPLVSIVTPSYNQGRFIEDTILSVKNQDYSHIEHIVVDGESTDNTLEILKKFENEYDLKWISESDKGQSDAINKGFKMAKGKIIGWLNSDDTYFTKDTISFVVKDFKKFPDVDILYGDHVYMAEDSLITRVRLVPNFNFKRLLRDDFIPQPSTFFRRHVIQKHELDINIDLPMDYEYWLRLAKNGIKFKHVNKILSAARIHKAMKTLSRSNEMETETKQVQKMYGQKFNSRYHHLKNLDYALFALLRIYGLTKLMYLYLKTKDNYLAFPAKFDSMIRAMLRQLFYDSRLRIVFTPLFFKNGLK